MSETTSPIRVDGYAKVTGVAQYVGDFRFEGMATAIVVSSTIARGRIRVLDIELARAAPGVLAVLTHENAPRLRPDDDAANGKSGEQLLPLSGPEIFYAGQPIAVVVAERIEQVEAAALQLRVVYDKEVPDMDLVSGASRRHPAMAIGEPLQSDRGDVVAAFSGSSVTIDATYTTPYESQNPIETSASIAFWEGDQLTVYDTTQAVVSTRNVVAHRLGIAPEQVTVRCPFVGGGFGCKGFVWHQPVLAALAARMTGRPVRLVLSRAQMFTLVGHRPQTIQRIRLGSDVDGRLGAIEHLTTSSTSQVDEFVEACGFATRLLYACPNVRIRHEVVALNTGTPGPMRAPGKAPGLFALESAIDELAVSIGADPLELRMRNYADHHPENGRPWSGKHLHECYRRGAERFGWARRAPGPRMMQDGREWVGYGMATSVFPAYRSPAGAAIRITDDGFVDVFCATQDLGTGTYTIITQVTSGILAISPSRIRVHIGDSAYPAAPVSGGSQTAASVIPAVESAARMLKDALLEAATAHPSSVFSNYPREKLTARDGALWPADDPLRSVSYGELVASSGQTVIERRAEVRNDEHAKSHAFQSFGAQFVEVRVDPDVGRVRVVRCVGVFDCGKILNPVMARSQFIGGMIWGIGMALLERTVFDERRGRIVTDNLADYLVAVNADIPEFDVDFINEPDRFINPIGVRGIGEIGITGTAAAIANAVYHATGRRIRDLPITLERLLSAGL
ncbi:MAG: xanthine dehydrogenase family protein molybdopterin-binding subunit [Acidiferrobacteraceae bacterium]